MQCTLMNKNTPIIDLQIDHDSSAITKVLKVYDLNYLPVGIEKRAGLPNRRDLNEWWQGRSIPASRLGILEALEHLEMFDTKQLLMKCFGLSLSDQYWMKPADLELSWTKVNFFENSFSEDVGNALFGQPLGKEADLMSPCNTSDGWLRKKWKIINGKRCLIKGGSAPYMQEPLNEVFPTKLLECMGMDNHVSYGLLWEEQIPYSICENFITTNTELVSAVSINKSLKKRSQYFAYEHFLRACDSLGIPGIHKFLDQMLVFDYLMANTDRHFGNFGAVRNVETLEWMGPAPIFDSGTSLWHNILTSRIQPLAEVDTKPFCTNETKQLSLITDFTWIPFEKLKNLHQELYNIFIQSPYLDEQRCCALSQAFQERMTNLQYLAAHRKK